ncbi:hypothetical protein DAERI_130067 [Deinococcus aerius]|uniref:Uncharacterized protein n=1 Tax=Deinococcus aerius TaxID=200253 RepID=A0A2I9DW83_9DEIO|nr:hypothetical protein [Deinococcus aerius]GBF07237.1 hypothetical protein DAERI_130067 [Deinococcus aerius]
MTGPFPDEPHPAQTPDEERGEVVISGLDTGPGLNERENVSPTDELVSLQPLLPHKEPEDEDG